LDPTVADSTTGRPYTPAFYADISAGSLRSARKVVPHLTATIAPKSVIDVGCGTGSWLRAFKESGVPRVVGLDGDWVKPEALMIQPDEFRRTDLTAALSAGDRYDLAMSVEVAEHLPARCADAFVDFLTTSAPVVLFSAAVPLQGGTEHSNEQWPSYWEGKFRARGFHAIDRLRWKIWDDREIEWWYRQNLLLFVHDSERGRFARLEFDGEAPSVPGVIHPESPLAQQTHLLDAASLGVMTLLSALPRALKRAISTRVQRR
jgi:SAM-dependent methyltransferase